MSINIRMLSYKPTKLINIQELMSSVNYKHKAMGDGRKTCCILNHYGYSLASHLCDNINAFSENCEDDVHINPLTAVYTDLKDLVLCSP